MPEVMSAVVTPAVAATAGRVVIGSRVDGRGADRVVSQALEGAGKRAGVGRGGDADRDGGGDAGRRELRGQERGEQVRPPRTELMHQAGLAGAGSELCQCPSLTSQFIDSGRCPERGHDVRRPAQLPWLARP